MILFLQAALQEVLQTGLQVLGGIILLLIATLAFDVLHVILHRFADSRRPLLHALGDLHMTHHRFLDNQLMIHEALIRANVWRHVIPEFITQLLVTAALAAFFPWLSVAIAFALEVFVFIFIMWGKPGFDVNHYPVDRLLPYQPLYFCVPEYHLLHHRYPSAYFSSWIKTLDHFLCTGTALKNRRVLLTGSETPFGQALITELKNHGALVNLAMEAEILVLCHVPTTETMYSREVEKFYAQHQSSRFPVEVWALASADTEEKRAAKEWFRSGKVIYRHIAIDSYQVDAACAKQVIKNIRRGFNFVPARWNGAMLKNYWQLLWR